MKFQHQILASILAFLIGYELLLPTSTAGIVWFKGVHFYPPLLMTRIEVIKGFFLKDVFAIIYIFVVFANKSFFQIHPNLSKLSKVYYLFFLYGIFIAVFTNNYYDIFENFRLLIIILSVISLNQSVKHKTINAFVLGVTISGILNLIVSYNVDLFGLKPIFFLVNQNGPGPIAGILLILFYDYNNLSKFFTFFKSILLLIVLLSLSKIAYLILVLFFFKITWSSLKVRKIRLLVYLFFSFLISLTVIQSIFDLKFSNNRFTLIDAGGDQTRLAYYTSSFKIFLDNPEGVSYSGYYDVVSKTDEFKNGSIVEDNKERANPHSTLLYYLSSHGIFGVFVLCLFFSCLLSYRNYREDIFLLIAIFIFMTTIPFLFVSYFFILPLSLLDKE